MRANRRASSRAFHQSSLQQCNPSAICLRNHTSPSLQRSFRVPRSSVILSPCLLIKCWVSRPDSQSRSWIFAPIFLPFQRNSRNFACLQRKRRLAGLDRLSDAGFSCSHWSLRLFGDDTSLPFIRLHCSRFSSACTSEISASFQGALDQLEFPSTPADLFVYTSLVQQCGHAKALLHGQLLHALIFMDTALCKNTHLMSLLVQMYGLCTALEDACAVFLQMKQKNVYSWNIMMGTNVKHEKWLETAHLFQRMQMESVLPDKYTIVSILSAHIGLETLSEGKTMHARFAHTETEENVVVGTALVNLYGHCGSPKYAKIMFENLQERDLVSCNAMVTIYAQQGQEKDAFQLFDHMLQEGFVPNKVTFLGVVDACNGSTGLFVGKKLHAYVSHTGFESDAFVLTTLLSMYGKCDNTEMADILFDELSERNVVSWNAIIAVHAHQDHRDDVLQLLNQMQQEGSIPDKVTFRTILCSFTGQAKISKGKLLHIVITSCGFDTDIVVGTALFSMYGRCGSLAIARKLFDGMSKRDVVAWNAMIALYTQNTLGGEALELMKQMQESGVPPDKVTLICGLSACAGVSFEAAQSLFETVRERDVVVWNAMLGACEQHGHSKQACHLFEKMLGEGLIPDKVTYLTMLCLFASTAAVMEGKWVHTLMFYNKYESDGPLVSALINMYNKCCCLDEARSVFQSTLERDAVVFNSIITACIEHEDNKKVLQIWIQMQQEAVVPDEVTCIGILDACATDGILALGKFIHACIMKSDYRSDISVTTSLFNMYHKCSSLEEAHLAFSSVVQHDVVSWTAIISANAEQNESKVVLQLFHQMQNEGVHADSGIYVNVLAACADEAALTEGKVLHLQIIHNDSRPDVSLGNALTNMYCKCGSMDDAQREFHKVAGRDALSFNVMIAGFAQHGHGKEALQLYDQMQQEGTIPNEYTFSSMLSACSHGGLVEEGRSCLVNMIEGYCWTPTIEHCDCMVDLLGRSGQLEEADCLLGEIPLQPTVVSYMTLLSAATIQMDVGKGEQASRHLFELDLKDASSYVALANLYALAGKGVNLGVFNSEIQQSGIETRVAF